MSTPAGAEPRCPRSRSASTGASTEVTSRRGFRSSGQTIDDWSLRERNRLAGTADPAPPFGAQLPAHDRLDRVRGCSFASVRVALGFAGPVLIAVALVWLYFDRIGEETERAASPGPYILLALAA